MRSCDSCSTIRTEMRDKLQPKRSRLRASHPLLRAQRVGHSDGCRDLNLEPLKNNGQSDERDASVCDGTTTLACRSQSTAGLHYAVLEFVVLSDDDAEKPICGKKKVDTVDIGVSAWFIEPDAILQRILVLENDPACIGSYFNPVIRAWILVDYGDGLKQG